ncbi:MAG TPA: DnaA N-terminal domain-containing protein, partial [Chloroflexota bacterium]
MWQRVLSRLKLNTGEAHFDTYLRGTQALAYDPGASVIRVTAANPFHVPWLEGKLSSSIHTAVADIIGEPIRVEFVADPAAQPASTPRRARPAPLLAPLDLEEARAAAVPQAIVEFEKAAPSRNGPRLNARYTFDSFVVGPSNRLAHAASLAIVDHIGTAY